MLIAERERISKVGRLKLGLAPGAQEEFLLAVRHKAVLWAGQMAMLGCDVRDADTKSACARPGRSLPEFSLMHWLIRHRQTSTKALGGVAAAV
ncbi:hypothetical protein [Microvirga guangxiensis]|uniref:Uncharacterized protein n=1 Tax=Microvirga guangxiensis TaxID=549386 RepID=A0A1G5JSI0_9HYPH|nr:hypothetical protein [Microvirga guangxiensis]SCY90820.1 hypothetical protein SAMN02927923_02839 [Microvirga guangxiensis]